MLNDERGMKTERQKLFSSSFGVAAFSVSMELVAACNV